MVADGLSLRALKLELELPPISRKAPYRSLKLPLLLPIPRTETRSLIMHRIRPGSTAPGGACLSAVLSAFLLSPALMTGCSDLASEKAERQAILGCDSQGNAHPICGFRNPEDLAPLPGSAMRRSSNPGSYRVT